MHDSSLYYHPFNKYLMTDKHKQLYIPQKLSELKTLKNYTATNITVGLKPTMNSQTNGSVTSESPAFQRQLNPIGSSFSSGQYLKNYSSNKAHFNDRVDHLNNNKKKE